MIRKAYQWIVEKVKSVVSRVRGWFSKKKNEMETIQQLFSLLAEVEKLNGKYNTCKL